MNNYRLIIYAPINSDVDKEIPLLPGQEILTVDRSEFGLKVCVDMGDEDKPSRDQLRCMMKAGVTDIVIARVREAQPAPQAVEERGDNSILFGFMLMVAACGAAAFLHPQSIPWIAGLFGIVLFAQWVWRTA